MTVWVQTIDGEYHHWSDVEVTFDTTVLQVKYEACTTTFPLSSVIAFSIDTAASAP